MSIEPIAAGSLRRVQSNWFRYDLAGHIVLLGDLAAIIAGSLFSAVAYEVYKGEGATCRQ